ncbi:L-ascorbate metabolism protein UlaG, beta-lactamase superfamily [Pricia antarctica]|uniref:L-ascorbate metabolism protein UlaG, beta-lactamase superfamily n=2 Tax=Pricia antarctica TaxID=641691 RepID=A0A1G7HWH8_9FLAO|nr:L-ascorbate metabolism protein UlaG, beta-lactamase superfamily [Pricia antarctica]
MFVKNAPLLFLLIFLSFQSSSAQKEVNPVRMIDEIKTHTEGLAVWWTGHNGWLIKYNDILIGTDLALESEDRAVPSPISAKELAEELDISFITHEHGDHFERETSKILAQKGNCVFVMPSNCKEIAIQEVGIPEQRINVATPRVPFNIGDVKIEPVRAIHGNSKFAVYYDANLEDCGYLITIGGKRFLQMGDTVLLEDHLFLEKVDVLFFSPTEHNTHIDPSLILINELEPTYILPQHRDTFKVTDQNRYWTTGYPNEVKFRLSKPMQERYHILEIGDKIDIEDVTEVREN